MYNASNGQKDGTRGVMIVKGVRVPIYAHYLRKVDRALPKDIIQFLRLFGDFTLFNVYR